MKLYIHKDTFYDKVYGDRTWWRRFEWLLDKKYPDIDYEMLNLHYENNINDLQLGNDDYCICRFAHYEEDFELSKRVYPLLVEVTSESRESVLIMTLIVVLLNAIQLFKSVIVTE